MEQARKRVVTMGQRVPWFTVAYWTAGVSFSLILAWAIAAFGA
jgi:hypothetical protein